jgi:hypothetical protein
MDEQAAMALFMEQIPPVVTTPEELIAQGLMSQIPYAKTSRVPDGWEKAARRAVNSWSRDKHGRITERHVALWRGTEWAASDDPDVPKEIAWRVGIIGGAAVESVDPDRWIAVMEKAGDWVTSSAWVDDREQAVAKFGEYQAQVERYRAGEASRG